MRAGKQQSEESGPALEKLCQAYWYPLYAYVRREGRTSHEAQDLTQEFFASLLETHALEGVHPDKGRFRSFLIASLRHFLANERKHSHRQKRGGGRVHFSLDEERAEGRYQHEPSDNFTPERAFERRWAETLLQGVLDRLRDEWDAKDTTLLFENVKPFLIGSEETATFQVIARRLGVTEASLKWTVHKLRQRYQKIFREEIANTVSTPEEIEDEIRHLFVVLTQ